MATISRLDVPVLGAGDLEGFDPAIAAEKGAVLLVDKPIGWTSFDVVAKTRGALRVRKVGHTGTLDPMATGLLILCLGLATKLVDELQAEEKEYTGTIRFGATTETDDAEGEERDHRPYDHLTREAIEAEAARFLGETLQIPPMFSARKVEGKRLYKLARKGQEVERPARPITVTAFEITNVDLPHADFRLVCSKGTYVRSIARDLGEALGTGAYLTALRRTRSGEFLVDRATTIDEISALRRPHVVDLIDVENIRGAQQGSNSGSEGGEVGGDDPQ